MTYDLAIFAALAWERRAVTASLAALRPGGRERTWEGRLGDGARCLVVQTGIGPERARDAASAVSSGLLLGCGCAGALAPWLRPGDLVSADHVLCLDAGGRVVERLPAHGETVAAWAARRGVRIHVGGVVSSPGVLASPAAKAAAGEGGALVVEMESAGLASIAAARGVPFVGLRVVLDDARQGVPSELDVVDATTGKVGVGRAMRQLALRPRLWPVMTRLGRQTRVAERRLRATLAALLVDGGMTALVEPMVGEAASR